MQDDLTPNTSFVVAAALFEGGLAVVAVSLGWVLNIPPLETFRWTFRDIGWGVLAVAPLLGALWLCLSLPLRPFRKILELLDASVLPLFSRCSLLELAGISFLAGLGEELLFRPIVQGGLARWIGEPAGPVIGLAAAAVIFGLMHRITVSYAVLAGLIGLYLGLLWTWTGNLLAPIITHALYDFLALTYLAKIRPPPVEDS
ncbi:MAG: CPBP family intramembrane metalloprotease [Pirellulales bacterium]|nr:CPBP family intramembrane metalloprotease [Pirellulales bacterium]